MKKIIHVLIPRLDRSGPSLGAVALFNTLSTIASYDVYLHVLRPCGLNSTGAIASKRIFFYDFSWVRAKSTVARMQRNISNFGDVSSQTLITYCLSADFISSSLKGFPRRFSSIRGDLRANYTFTYGNVIGIIILELHFFLLRKMAGLISMSSEMTVKLRLYQLAKTTEIPNFLDESSYKKEKRKVVQQAVVFLYVGSFTKRKNVLSLIRLFCEFSRLRIDCRLHLVGSGPLQAECDRMIRSLRLCAVVHMFPFTDEPSAHYNTSNIYVNLSLSEGTSRSTLEALYHGLPCLVSNVGCNSSLIDSSNGVLSLGASVLDFERVYGLYIKNKAFYDSAPNLLPNLFRQVAVRDRYCQLLSE